MNNRNKLLLQYSALSLAFLDIQNSTAEVMYTDIEPDKVLDTLYGTFYLDMNIDGLIDFHFSYWHEHVLDYDYYGEPSGSTDKYGQWVGGYFNPKNHIMAARDSFYTSSATAIYVWYLPYALNSGSVVSDGQEWKEWYYQRMAFKSYRNNNFTHIFREGGYWWPGADEKFLGVRFADTEDQVHYGWIRCSIIDSAEGLIIHDFAYETTPDYPILAGSLTSYVGLEESNAPKTELFAFNGTLYVKNAPLNSTLIIFDLTGKQVSKAIDISEDQTFTFELPAGMYLARLQVEGISIIVKKIIL